MEPWVGTPWAVGREAAGVGGGDHGPLLSGGVTRQVWASAAEAAEDGPAGPEAWGRPRGVRHYHWPAAGRGAAADADGDGGGGEEEHHSEDRRHHLVVVVDAVATAAEGNDCGGSSHEDSDCPDRRDMDVAAFDSDAVVVSDGAAAVVAGAADLKEGTVAAAVASADGLEEVDAQVETVAGADGGAGKGLADT